MYKYNCDNCKKDFLCKTNRERKNHFCTHGCYSDWLKNGNGSSSKTVFKKGHIGYNRGKKLSEETKRKISKYQKTRFHETGELSTRWRGGVIHRKGYVFIYKPDHPNACKQYISEHRLVVEGIIGRVLDKSEVVHHIDGDKKNNSPSNLMLFPNESEHQKHHWRIRRQSR